jgi:purine-cytosine permease-like protein
MTSTEQTDLVIDTPPPAGILAAVEHRSIDFIPDTERHGRIGQQGVFWFLSNTQPLSVTVGFLGPVLGLSVPWTIVAVILGTLFGTTFQALHASQGPHLGLPQMLQSRAQFGYRGVVLPLIIALFSFLAYTILDSIILALGLEGIFGVSKVVTIVGAAAIAVVLAIYGYDWLHKAFKWTLWVSLPLWILLSLGIVTGQAGGAEPTASLGFAFIPFAAQFAYAAGINLSYGPAVSDYSRYLPRTTPFRSVILSVYAGSALSLIWLAAIGAWLAANLGASDGMLGIYNAGNNVIGGLGGVLVVVSSFALVMTMGEMAYSGSLTVLTAGTSLGIEKRPTFKVRAVVTTAIGIAWTAAGLLLVDGGQTAVYDLILLVFYVLVPWSAINLVDYFFVRRGKYAITHLFRPDGVYGSWPWRGAVAYGIGLLAIVPFVQVSFYKGFLVESVQFIDVSYISGLLVAGLVYFLLTQTQDFGADAAAVEESHAELLNLGLLSRSVDESHEASQL